MKMKRRFGKRLMTNRWCLPQLFLFVFLFVDNNWMMGWGHMVDWWGIPFMGIWMIGVWLVFVIIAFLVYQDANKRGMNGLLWFVLVVLPLIGIIFFIVYLVIREENSTHHPGPNKSAHEVLDERFAKGEISTEEYQQKKKELKKDG